MLVLSRKLGERIFIADNIIVTVVDIDRGKVRLGIEAPRDIAIQREELRGRDEISETKGHRPSEPRPAQDEIRETK